MKLYNRITIAISDEDLKILDKLRKENDMSYSAVIREALDLYYRLYTASKKAGFNLTSLKHDVERLAWHIYNVELGMYVILDKEYYRVIVKKLQEYVPKDELEKDEEFRRALKGLANLFKLIYRWGDETEPEKKVEELLKSIEFAGGGELVRAGGGFFVFKTLPEHIEVMETAIKILLDHLGVNYKMDTSGDRIFIQLN